MKARRLARLGAMGALTALITGAIGCSSSSSSVAVGDDGGLLVNAAVLDLDGDGVLTFMEANGGTTTVTQEEFDAIDTNGDTFLSLSELVGATGIITNGGQLYDTFWLVAMEATAPVTDHPLWVTQTANPPNARTGSDTWRCTECHGWDYKGAAGAYGTGSHATGFKGILTLLTATTDFEVFDLIKIDHGYGAKGLADAEILDLTDFVLNGGLLDTDAIIDATGAFIGDGSSGGTGEALFNTCASCHGADGMNMPPQGSTNAYFGDFSGFVSSENPWEFQHKVSFGQPGTAMPPQLDILTVAEIGDLGAYAQTLPDLLPLPGGILDVVNGGRLYDDWFAESGATPPATDHPLWADQTAIPRNARTGSDTWRCRECHGWDYKGAAGAYAIGNHATGFAGIFGTTQTLQEVYNTIWVDHQYGNKMSNAKIQDAAEFVLNGQLDVDAIIDGTGAFIGDGAPGGTGNNLYFSRGCVACHGADGLNVPPITSSNLLFENFPGFISNNDPQEFQHIINYGRAGESMAFTSILLVTETGDLGAYAQTLPQN